MADTRGVRVLIADDQPEMLSALSDLVQAHPELELVGTAGDADEAVTACEQFTPDVVLVDVRMPGGGEEVARVAKKLGARGVVALSAHDDQDIRARMAEAGVDRYVVKGGSVEEIIDALLEAAGS